MEDKRVNLSKDTLEQDNGYGLYNNQTIYDGYNNYSSSEYIKNRKRVYIIPIIILIIATTIVGIGVVSVITNRKHTSEETKHTIEYNGIKHRVYADAINRINEQISDTSMCEDMSYEDEMISIKCLGVVSKGDTEISDKLYFLVGNKTNNKLDINTESFINNFHTICLFEDTNDQFADYLDKNREELLYVKSSLLTSEHAFGQDVNIKSYDITIELKDEDHSVYVDKVINLKYNADKDYRLTDEYLEGYTEIYNKNGITLYLSAKNSLYSTDKFTELYLYGYNLSDKDMLVEDCKVEIAGVTKNEYIDINLNAGKQAFNSVTISCENYNIDKINKNQEINVTFAIKEFNEYDNRYNTVETTTSTILNSLTVDDRKG
ncbi:MAG: hypothetical protein J6A59_10980 [Lachnospiraceae bacterium]|nr:hypothetical protein [Lachnospiraceae bacterium]